MVGGIIIVVVVAVLVIYWLFRSTISVDNAELDYRTTSYGVEIQIKIPHEQQTEVSRFLWDLFSGYTPCFGKPVTMHLHGKSIVIER